MLKEACVEDFASAAQMIAAGAGRIELNSDLSTGGTTPSFGLIKKTVDYAHHHNVPVVVMIRPRGGNFVYDEAELAIMVSDIQVASLAGADAVTFGCLTKDCQLNQLQMKRLINLSRNLGLEVVMHMAFDAIPAADQQAALNWLVTSGVCRILTHGGSLDQPILATIPHLKKIMEWAGQRIAILPGGGITATNCATIANRLNVEQLHGTRLVATKKA
ncbi:copper homeostasis protein CutC [Lactobacillus xylocopicola]|uniref:PF03932 family protein CutC n=1 Tax=Lactobacillus xylocopicola TaxID=2976676 RepID=A0ABM8BH13_9LACO|nr:copper homeostasis protein CutC [Lactobacillus xylocopicola]BDR60570.1 copper homeostasis protein [Lactobacillus xylocopicola]